MSTIPITPGALAGDILEAYQRKYLEGSDLAAWAEALIEQGYAGDAVSDALISEDAHWQEIPVIFAAVCKEIGLGDEPAADIGALKQRAMIEEFRHGHRKAAELFQRFDDLRERAEFAEWIEFRLLPDNPDGSNDSGYYSVPSAMHGVELEQAALDALKRLGIVRNESMDANRDRLRVISHRDMLG